MPTHRENDHQYRQQRLDVERVGDDPHHLTDVDDFWDTLPAKTKKHLLDNGARLEFDERISRITITVDCEPNCSFCKSARFGGRFDTQLQFVSLTRGGKNTRLVEINSKRVEDSEGGWYIDLKTIGLASIALMAMLRFSSVTATANVTIESITTPSASVLAEVYIVQPGDTLSVIAQRLGTTTELLAH